MFARLFHLALIVALAGCPVFCHARLCCVANSAAGVDAPARCCSHCCHNEHRQQQDKPANDDRCECQCVCNGAIMPSVVHVDLSALVRSLDGIPAPPPALVAAEICGDSPVDSPHHHRATPGRMICCLHSALLC